ncbi:MAG: hypothetical protein KAJ16_07590 [Calditrichia bacterium]|nr:hypothetical protein [Calditrichia bacterium]MCK5454207.1 hypothetical protein [Calditrichia bacterium]NOQ96638.1 hypothetical protein [Calditrichia bacterium]
MHQKPTEKANLLDPDILNNAYSQFFLFVSEYVGDKKAKEFARQSYLTTEKYYRGISVIIVDDQNRIRLKKIEVTDREILGFSIWMHQFIAELKKFMVGIGKVDPKVILGKWGDSLKPTGFFEYFKQAKDLKY